jgi:membrane protein required for colicin V production
VNAINLAGLAWIDYGIIGIVALSALLGLGRGLVREVLSLALWIGAAWVALHYNHAFAPRLQRFIELEPARLTASFVLIYLGVLIVGGAVARLVAKLVSSAGLDGSDRFAGLLFGVARGALIVAILVMLAGVTPLPHEAWWNQSKLIPPFQSLALWLRDNIPEGLAAHVKFPEAFVKR